MSEDLYCALTEIDMHFSRDYHMRMLKFLANSVVVYGHLERCNSVPEVYTNILRNHKESVAVALLRHMLHVTGYKREKINLLDSHCSEEFVLTTVAPSLPFYEVLLLLASKLVKNNHYKEFLSSVDENKLSKSRHDISSPVDLFQSMIHMGTLDPHEYSTLNEVVAMLEASRMTEESQFMRQSINQSRTAETVGEEGLTVSVAVYYNHKGFIIGLDGSGGRGNARVGPDSEGEPAMEVQTTVKQSPLQMLDQVLDFENGGVSKHLGQIADSMYEWEGPVAEQLGLTPAEIAAIKLKYPSELGLQTRAALEKWKQKLGSSATYSNLIGVFEHAGYQGYADTVHKVLRESPPDHTSHNRQLVERKKNCTLM